jgi:uroporphyrinogen decarboxylase
MNAYEMAPVEHRKLVDQLLADTAANGGLAPVDVDQFWKDQDIGFKNAFGKDIAQVPLYAICTDECVYDELGIPVDFWRLDYGDEAWARDIKRRYNDLAAKLVGRRLLSEKRVDRSMQWPEIKKLHDIFEAENVWEGGAAGSWWIKHSASTPEELSALLDRVERRLENLREFMLPENWEAEKQRLVGLGREVPLYRGQRGPCTFATSIYGAENLLLLFYDDPGLFARFSDVIRRAILARAQVLDVEAGYTGANAKQRGWGWWDDNCCLFNTEMYEMFAMPIHREVLGRYAPEPGDRRYQHSDSAMGHLLPQLSELKLNGVNFGPTLTVREIREHCPMAVIDGQLAPFTFSRNEEANMVAEFLRDFEQAKEKRGLRFGTAGSVNNGSRLTGMRLLMAAIQRYGWYGG